MKRMTQGSGVFLWVAFFFLTLTSMAFAQEKVIKLGLLAPMKMVVGEHEATGGKIAVEEINKAGGVKVKGVPHKFELLVVDDNEYVDLREATSAMEKVITIDKADFLLGGYRSEAVLAMQEVMANYQKIFISGGWSPQHSERLSKNFDKYKYWFRHSPNMFFYNTGITYGLGAMANKIRQELGIAKPRVGIMVVNITVADPVPDFTKAAANDLGVEVVGVWKIPVDPSDLSAELTAVKNADVHILQTFVAAMAGPTTTKALNELKTPVASIGYNDFIQMERAWKNSNEGCNYQSSFVSVSEALEITPKTQPLVKKFREAIKEAPLVQGVGVYDSVHVLKEAIERADSLDTDAVVAALEKTDYVGAQGRIAFFPKGHKWPHDMQSGPGYVPYVGVEWQDGKLLSFWPDGQETYDKKGWKGIKYPGTVDYKLPPWMVEYWKAKKGK